MKRTEAILADLQTRIWSDAEVARRHGVTTGRVWHIRRAAGLPRWLPPTAATPVPPSYDRIWTERDLDDLITRADEPVAEVAPALGRSIRAVYEMRHRLAQAGRLPRRRVPFSAEELALLADPTRSTVELAEQTGRTPEVIADARRRRGIRAPRE